MPPAQSNAALADSRCARIANAEAQRLDPLRRTSVFFESFRAARLLRLMLLEEDLA